MLTRYRAGLRQDDTFSTVTLEDVVAALADAGVPAARELRARYLGEDTQ